MGLHYSGGLGMLYDRDSDLLVDKVNYQLIESDGSIYTKKRWWGDFVTGREIKDAGRSFTLELSDGRRGECFVRQNAEMLPKADKFFYHFNGRGKLGSCRDF